MTSTTHTTIVRAHNDIFRSQGYANGDWVITQAIMERGHDFLIAAIKAVRNYDGFTEGDDPYGEHDFGSFTIDGQKLFWKIDLYDPGLVKIPLNGSFC